MSNASWRAGALERVESKARSFADDAEASIFQTPSRALLYDKTVWAAGALSTAAGVAAGVAIVAASPLASSAGLGEMALAGAYCGFFAGLGGIFIGALAGDSVLRKASSMARKLGDLAQDKREAMALDSLSPVELEAFRARRADARGQGPAPAEPADRHKPA